MPRKSVGGGWLKILAAVVFIAGMSGAQTVPNDNVEVQFAAVSLANRVCKQEPNATVYLPVGGRWAPLPCHTLIALELTEKKVPDFFDEKAKEREALNAKIDEVLRTLRGR